MKKDSKNKTAFAYARAWFDAAKEQKKEDVVLNEVKALQKSIQDDTASWSVLFSTEESNDTMSSFISDFAKQTTLSDISTELLKLLVNNRRLNLLNLILDGFLKLYYDEHNIIEVSVDTAVPLTKAQDALLNKTLAKKLNAQILINYHVKPEILGGLNVRFKSYQINDTLLDKLERIKMFMLGQEV